MTRILLVRHGRTEDAAARRYSGRRDVPLDEYGREQARILAGRLAGEAIDLALTSDLARAVLTAGIILGGRPVSAVPDPRLREIDFGLWEGLTHEEILARDGEAYRRWLDDPMAPIPSGECLPSMVERVLGCLTEAAGACGGTVLAVAHGGPIAAVLCLADGAPFRGFRGKIPPHGSLTEVVVEGGRIRRAQEGGGRG